MLGVKLLPFLTFRRGDNGNMKLLFDFWQDLETIIQNDEIMIHETTLRVRYSETDQMGIVYYANYFVWMEVGRTSLIKECGISYKEIEEKGFLLPVAYTAAKFINPSFYDDEIVVQSGLIEFTKTKVSIGYKIFRSMEDKRELVCVGVSDLVCLDKITRKITKLPEFFVNSLKTYDTNEYREFVKFVKNTLRL
jgi:acyl-CoA thioester hydrolase